jgi:PAS domain S-box-containing protein
MNTTDNITRNLHKRESIFRSLLEKFNLLVFVFDEKCEVTYACGHVPDVLHVPSESLLGIGYYGRVVPENKNIIKPVVDELSGLPEESRMIENLCLLTQEGKRLYFDGTITNLKNDPEIRGFVMHIFDVTGRKEAQDALREVNFELDNFVYRASHDMRAPLLSVIGLVNVAMHDPSTNTERYLEMIKNSMLKLDRFIRDLTEYSVNERIEFIPVPTNFDFLIRQVWNEMDYLKNYRKVEVTIHSPRQEVIMDASRMKILIHNLLSNAIKFADLGKSSPAAKITVAIRRGIIEIEMNDNGIGILSDHQTKVFDMFFRGSELSEGSGLGLYIVKKIVQKLKGSVELRSELGKGTTLTVLLPMTV